MRFRKDLGRPGLIGALAECFGAVDDPVDGRRFSLGDHLMAAFAMFPLKYPSLLQSGRDSRRDAIVRGNLRTLFGIAAAPCDSAMRKRLDAVDPRQLRPASGPCSRGCSAAGCRGPAGFRRPLPDPGRRHRPFQLEVRPLRPLPRRQPQ